MCCSVVTLRANDTQQNDIQYNDTQQNDIQYNDTQQNDIQYNDTQQNDIQYNETQDLPLLETFSGQSSKLYLNVVHFFNTSVN